MDEPKRKSIKDRLLGRLAHALMPLVNEHIGPAIDARVGGNPPPFLPPVDVFRSPASAPFMQYSNCHAEDFRHPEFLKFSNQIQIPIFYHRKLWEYVFILHHAERLGCAGPGKRALAFGVGSEPLPAAFAKGGTAVTATDAPTDIGVERGWTMSNQLALGLSTLPNGVLDRAEFERLVQFDICDMNDIGPQFQNFDFCWSSCAFEHLGSIQKGLDFVVNSVEKTLRVGGVAIHTTEFNLSSNTDTVDNAWTVLFRRRDFEDLSRRLQDLGHKVEPFVVSPPSGSQVDNFVDIAPYSSQPHLRLLLENFTTTSAGLIVTRQQ